MSPNSEIWRVGRTLGRTLYIQAGDGPSKDDRCIGLLDTRELAGQVVAAMNGPDAGELIRLRNRIAALEENGAELLRRAEKAEAELEKADAAELKRTKALLKMAERHAMNCDANQAAAEAGQARAEARYAGLNAHHLRTVADHRAELDAMTERAEKAEATVERVRDLCREPYTAAYDLQRDIVAELPETPSKAPESSTTAPADVPAPGHLFGGGR